MSVPSTVLSGSVSAISIGVAYAIGQNSKWVAVSALMNSIRPFTDRYFEGGLGERSLEILHGGATLLLIGMAGNRAKLPWKTRLATLAFFTVFQIGTRKLANQIYREQIAREQFPPYRKKMTVHKAISIGEQLSLGEELEIGQPKVYLYMMEEGFLLFLSESGELPFFGNLMRGPDDSGALEIFEATCGTLSLSPQAMEKLRQQARQVSHGKGKRLEGISPFVCFEGRRCEEMISEAPVDWEALILNEHTQRHPNFELIPLTQTRTPVKQQAGISFVHSKGDFTISVRERSREALQRELEGVKKEIRDFKNLLSFLQEFEKAAALFDAEGGFPKTPGGKIDWAPVEEWGKLPTKMPFHFLEGRYSNLERLVRRCKRSPTERAVTELKRVFENFFRTLPLEAHFPTDSSLAQQFQKAEREFRGQELDSRLLGQWLSLFEETESNFGENENLKALLHSTNQRLVIPGDLTELATQLNWFFGEYRPRICTKGLFIEDIREELVAREKIEIQLEMLSLCEKGLAGFPLETELQKEGGNKALLKEWVKILRCGCLASDRECQELRRISLDRIKGGQTETLEAIARGYRWLFDTHIPHLEAGAKGSLLEELAKEIGYTPSYASSTAEVVYSSPLHLIHLQGILRNKRGAQLAALTAALSSVRDGGNPLPEGFLEKSRETFAWAQNFLLRKIDHFLIVQQSWTWTLFAGDSCREVSDDLIELSESLENLHIGVIQSSMADAERFFLSEEVKILAELFQIGEKLLSFGGVPIRWSLHRNVHRHSLQIEKAQKALAEEYPMRMYKRISKGREVEWDIVRRYEKTSLELEKGVEAGLYSRAPLQKEK